MVSIHRKEQERGYSTTELGAQNRFTCGREAVKSVLRLFDELVKCDEEGVLKDVRKAVEGSDVQT